MLFFQQSFLHACPFQIQFLDSINLKPVPLVKLELGNKQTFFSDNDGNVSIDNPDFYGCRLKFNINGSGYIYPEKDFWGDTAIYPTVQKGKKLTVKLDRKCLAQRVFRITGAGKYKDSILLGLTPTNIVETDGQIFGQDSLVAAPFTDKLYCFWGDTIGYSNFNFSASGGVIDLKNNPDPEKKLKISYFCSEDGFAKKMVDTGLRGFTWIEYVLPVYNEEYGKKILLAKYVHHQSLEVAVESGFAIFSTKENRFKIFKREKSSKVHKCAHPFPGFLKNKKGYFLQPWEFVEDNFASVIKEREHWFLTCLDEVSKKISGKSISIEGKNYVVRRTAEGKASFFWKKGGIPVDPVLQNKLLEVKVLNKSDLWYCPKVFGGEDIINNFNGSIFWSTFKNRWAAIFQGNQPGEIFYSESDNVSGPWRVAIKVAEHPFYNLYNPITHPWFEKNGGREIFFEGTLTNYFSGNQVPYPGIDYNQVMYKLDLGDIPIEAFPAKDFERKSTFLSEEKPGNWE